MLDLMTICWAQEPCDRPSAAQVRMIASSPQFCHLSDAVTLDTKSTVLSACTVYVEEWVPGMSYKFVLTLSEMTIFRLCQTERLCKRQF